MSVPRLILYLNLKQNWLLFHVNSRQMKSFTAFLLRLREKSPVWYTFLKTQLYDTVSETPYEEWNEKQIALFVAEGLYHPRGAEIAVNLALASLCELGIRQEEVLQKENVILFCCTKLVLNFQSLVQCKMCNGG